MTAVLLLAGLLLLVLGGELLVRGASALARAMGMSPLVIGLTVVAFGTSAPELSASIAAAIGGYGDMALGNVVGSNIFNVLFILGVSALIRPLVVAQRLVRADVPIMIALSAAILFLGSDGWIGRLEGALLALGFVVFVFFSVRSSKTEGIEVQEEYAREFGGTTTSSRFPWLSLVLIATGFALLVVGSRWLVEGAVGIARAVGLSELLIGLTIVAAGTSVPEVATSVLAAWKGEPDIAVGNVVGSNILNILGVLGLSAIVAPDGIPVSPAALRFDIPIMVAAAVACLPVFSTGYRIGRWEGALLLAYYGAYVLFLVLDATEHDHLPAYSWIMMAFVVPLTILTLAVVLAREAARRRR